MAGGQLSDLKGFSEILSTYDVLRGPVTLPAALALSAAELTAGLGLLRGGRAAARSAPLAVAVAVAWSLLAAQAFARGVVLANCGCFGVHLGQPLWWGVLVQDGAFVAAAVRVTRTTTAGQGGAPSRAALTSGVSSAEARGRWG